MTNEEEYEKIVDFIDKNMPEYNDGSLSFPDIVEDLYRRINNLVEENGEMFALLSVIKEEYCDTGKITGRTQRKVDNVLERIK